MGVNQTIDHTIIRLFHFWSRYLEAHFDTGAGHDVNIHGGTIICKNPMSLSSTI